MNDFNSIVFWKNCNQEKKQNILLRPAISVSKKISKKVADIIETVKKYGDDALIKFNSKFDNFHEKNLRINPKKISYSKNFLNKSIKDALLVAMENIKKFHMAQKISPISIEIKPGIICEQFFRPIESVGIYIPNGSAPLFSTVLMLAIPAKIAGCKKILLCSPPPIGNEILYACEMCGIKDIFQIGGAHSIAALAFGTKSVYKVEKIFGPGNIWVTEAKKQVNYQFDGPAIDFFAGPSELLIIADSNARPDFIAADLLSQAEHGETSQVLLLTPSFSLASSVLKEIKKQIIFLPRSLIAKKALKNSLLIITSSLQECINISNQYGPEHLSIQTSCPRDLLKEVKNAGSVFLGKWSPESAGDYASGTNHVLPTYGQTATHSSIGLLDFQKRITVQELTKKGLHKLSSTIECLALAEKLEAHKNAITLRLS
ncbi:histidinol dehydrogenase [Candidatus Tachikawaea gelatinosa]|uniref:Histidinol dehydrogenase n=1 Tax=Candidatus Tachikawaea gelatinosa TaxID=1410383 RepID=A0A090AQT2_9ENTR|nr:histidinol dehydrogenase [Candidatus Tachikawaea gelatinosa]BAP58707.1 histidinol dehydrogenase [Candidatus Tachikawaea gelatinosa]